MTGAPEGTFEAVEEGLQPFVDRGDLSGVVTLTWQGGEVLQSLALGSRDLETGAPMKRDTQFWIASMTKPVTVAAALMLLEEGVLKLSDPVTKWLPEFKSLRVAKDPAGALDDTVPAERAPTVEELMTHKAGLAYGFTSTGALAQEHEKLGPPLAGLDPDDWIAALASIPLSYQPGERMHYSHSTELLGFLIARAAGTTLQQLLEERIFKPLGMKDTAFWLPPGRRDRLAKLYRFDTEAERLVEAPMPMPEAPPAYAAGGGGLISTADDYLQFVRLLLGNGEKDGVRLLKPETVADMRTNRLTAEDRARPFLGLPMWGGAGFGLNLSVVDAPERNMLGVGGVGAFTWPGAFGTWWLADPTRDLILIYLIAHSIPLGPDAGALIAAGRGMAGRMALPQFQRLTYAAVDAPH